MTVAELITELEQYPPDMKVMKYCYQGEYSDPVKDIEYTETETTDWRDREVPERVVL